MKSRFLSAAEEEFADAGVFYESKREGLGDEFFHAVLTTIGRLEEMPELGSPIGLGYRSIAVLRFPFRVVYGISGEEILIVAVAHQSRRPGYWLDRA